MPLITAAPTESPVGQQKKGVAERVASLPFARASKYHTEQGATTTGTVINTAAPGTFNFAIPSYGFLTGVILSYLATGGTGAAAVYYEDANINGASVFQSIALYDVNGSPIWGPMSGYSTLIASQFGGYRLFSPTGSTRAFGNVNTTTGAGAVSLGNNPVNFAGNTGNFGGVLPIWNEFGRDG